VQVVVVFVSRHGVEILVVGGESFEGGSLVGGGSARWRNAAGGVTR